LQVTASRIATMVDLTGDIIIPLITGGGIITLLGYLFDKLARNRAEQIDILRRRREMFSTVEPIYIQIAGYYLALRNNVNLQQNQKPDHRIIVYYICNILYLIEKHRRLTGGLPQLRDMYAERAIQQFMGYIYTKLLDSSLEKKLSLASLYRLRGLIKETTTYESFEEDIKSRNSQIYNIACELLDEMQRKGQFTELAQRSSWYANLIYLEINIMYFDYYGKKVVQGYYTKHNKLDPSLLIYLKVTQNEYYERLSRLKLVETNPLDV
jgi:hypothetical protein